MSDQASMQYSEAYCRLPVAELYRAHDRGEGSLVWRERIGSVIGSAKIMSRFDDVMHVAFELSACGAVEAFSGELPISIVWRDAGLHRREPYATCPDCGRAVKQLIARCHAWKCRTCHSLVNRGSLIRSNARLTEQVEHLEGEVGRGRPKGMHSSTYEARRALLAYKKARLGSGALRADSRYEQVVSHHVAGSRKKTVRKRMLKEQGAQQQLFQGRLITFLNDEFTARSCQFIRFIASMEEHEAMSIGSDLIVARARIDPIMLGAADETAERQPNGPLQTIVEVPFQGDQKLLLFGSEKGVPLPPCVAEIDASALLIRFVFSGSVEEQPALRIRIDEQLSVLRQQVERQASSLAAYNWSLQGEARRYIAVARSKDPGKGKEG